MTTDRPNILQATFIAFSLLGMALSTLAVSGGCYRRVVGTKNAPGYTGPIYEANVAEGNEDLFRTKTVTPTGSYYVD